MLVIDATALLVELACVLRAAPKDAEGIHCQQRQKEKHRASERVSGSRCRLSVVCHKQIHDTAAPAVRFGVALGVARYWFLLLIANMGRVPQCTVQLESAQQRYLMI